MSENGKGIGRKEGFDVHVSVGIHIVDWIWWCVRVQRMIHCEPNCIIPPFFSGPAPLDINGNGSELLPRPLDLRDLKSCKISKNCSVRINRGFIYYEIELPLISNIQIRYLTTSSMLLHKSINNKDAFVMMMMSITAITATIAVIVIITVIIIRMRTELMVVMIIILPLQICVSGVCGAPGQPVQSRAAVESGSGTDGPWPLLQGPAVRASRRRARAATQDFARVQRLLCLKLPRYLQTVKNVKEVNSKVIRNINQQFVGQK